MPQRGFAIRGIALRSEGEKRAPEAAPREPDPLPKGWAGRGHALGIVHPNPQLSTAS